MEGMLERAYEMSTPDSRTKLVDAELNKSPGELMDFLTHFLN